jgi:hypothetical protein
VAGGTIPFPCQFSNSDEAEESKFYLKLVQDLIELAAAGQLVSFHSLILAVDLEFCKMSFALEYDSH